VELRQETAEDMWEVEALYDTCFAPGRSALSSYRLRDGIPAIRDLSLVAVDENQIIGGAIRFWPVKVSDTEALLLGPIAVHPTRQGEGLGSALIREGTRQAIEAGWLRILLVGDAPYYQKFGFEKLTAVNMPPPTNPDRVLGLGDWAGVAGPVRRHTS